MRILRVASDLYPQVVGGIGIHVDEMSRWQAKFGHDVTLYIADNGKRFDMINGYQIYRFKPITKIFGNSLVPQIFFRLLKEKGQYDIIHAHSHLFMSTNICAMIRKINNIPLVITNHGLKSASAPDLIQNIYKMSVTKWTLNAADSIICYTEKEKKELIKIGIKKNINVIHNGIDTDLFIPPKNRPTVKGKRILWIGRFVRGKGLDYLIDAFKILKRYYPDIHLIMIGEGPEKGRINRKIRMLGLHNNISSKDFVPNSDIAKIYQNSDVFVLPSIVEGVPRTILEAMSCGLPVITTNLDHLVDIVRDCGLLTPKKDSSILAERILEVLSNTDMAIKLGENGRKNVLDNYSWKDTVKKTIKLYEDLI